MVALERCALLERRFDPQQPRVPAGNGDGGQWSDDGSGEPLRPKPAPVNARTPATPPRRVNDPSRIRAPAPVQLRSQFAAIDARAAIAEVHRYDPSWRPAASLTPNTTEGDIARYQGMRLAAETRLREITRSGFGGNSGAPSPRAAFDRGSVLFQPIRESVDTNHFRVWRGMPALEGPATSKAEGTVALATLDDGSFLFGVNSDTSDYTERDRTDADAMRAALVLEKPKVMATDNLGWIPNNALYHAEVTSLLRLARNFNGSLKGQKIRLKIDRKLCYSCEQVLPEVIQKLGSPDLTIVDFLDQEIYLPRLRP